MSWSAIVRGDWERRLRIVRIAAGTVLIGVLAWQAWRLPAQVGAVAAPSLEKVNGTLDNINATTLAGKLLVESVSRDYYDPKNPETGFYWDIQQMIYTSTVASRTTEEFIEDLRAAIIGGKDTRGVQHPGVIPAATGLLDSLKDTSDHFRADLDRLTADASGALQPLKASLENVARLTESIEKQMRDGGDVAGTF